jgi:hypothetical protein
MAGTKFQSKIMNSGHLPGVDFVVDAMHVDDDPNNPIVFEITVTAAGSSYTERHGYGSYAPSTGLEQNPVGPVLTQADLQSKLDLYRQQTTDRFAFMRAGAALAPNLK